MCINNPANANVINGAIIAIIVINANRAIKATKQ